MVQTVCGLTARTARSSYNGTNRVQAGNPQPLSWWAGSGFSKQGAAGCPLHSFVNSHSGYAIVQTRCGLASCQRGAGWQPAGVHARWLNTSGLLAAHSGFNGANPQWLYWCGLAARSGFTGTNTRVRMVQTGRGLANPQWLPERM